MNVRLELGLQGPGAGVEKTKIPIHEDYQNADKTTENQLIQGVLNNPEQNSNQTEDAMRQALARFKSEQLKLQAVDTSVAKVTEISDPVEQIRLAYAKHQGINNPIDKKIETETKNLTPSTNNNGVSLQRERIAILMQEAQMRGDKESYDLLEDQLLEIDKLLKSESKQEALKPDTADIETLNSIAIEDQQEKDLKPLILPETQQPLQESLINKAHEPSEAILGKLHELGIDYDELVRTIPNFASLSEGQQAYVLLKSEQQSAEHIKEAADADFAKKRQEAGPFKRFFKSGAMKREANRNALNAHKGLAAFSDDIETFTKYTEQAGIDISLKEDGQYIMEYVIPQESFTEKQKFFVDSYNKYATILSETPYEWSLKTATPKQRKEYKKAIEDFAASEKVLQNMYAQAGLDQASILQGTFGLRSKVELNQIFSNNKDIAKQVTDIKTATWQSDFTKKIISPGAVGMIAGRLLSKSLWGLGGAAGASAIIGGWMGIRQKNQEFNQDAKSARRREILNQDQIQALADKDPQYQKLSREYIRLSTEQKPQNQQRIDQLISEMEIQKRNLVNKSLGVKETTSKVFDARQNAERIGKLLAKIENEKDPKRKEVSLQALEDRLVLLDQRMKEGRVNFGNAKQQLENKTLLVAAMVEAQQFRFGLREANTNTNSRVGTYFDRQDSKSQGSRNKERAKAFVLGTGVGTVAGVVGWFIADWFQGEKAGEAVKAALDGPKLSPIENIIPPIETPSNPTDFEISVEASPKGAIETYKNLQNAIEEKYNGDYTNAPKYIQDFMSKTDVQLAMEDNMYRPGEVNESAKIYKGGKLGFNKAGERIYTDARNGIDILSGEGKFDGDHFDYDSYQSKNSPSNLGTGNAEVLSVDTGKSGVVDDNSIFEDKTADRSQLSDIKSNNIFAEKSIETNEVPKVLENNPTTSITEKPIPEGAKRVVISDKIQLDFSIATDLKGKESLMLYSTDLSQFDAYHKAYLKEDVASYAKKIFQNKQFQMENPNVKYDSVEKDLRSFTNQLIARDQLLQNGNFDPKSNEYKLIEKESKIIRQIIKNNFEFYEGDFLSDAKGNKFPDPNFYSAVENSQNTTANIDNLNKNISSQAASVNTQENIPKTIETAAPASNVEVSKVRVKNNVINQEFDFKFTKNSEGKLTGYIENYKPANVPEEYFKGRLGFDPDWKKVSGLDQTFKDSPEGKKILQKIEIAKVSLIGYDSFPPGTEEHELFKRTLIKTINDIEKDYPAIFEYNP